MKSGTNIAVKIAAIGVILVLSNFIYSHWFFERDVQIHSPAIHKIRKIINEKAEIVYFGESSNLSSSPNDSDKRFISQLLAAKIPSKKLVDLSKEASHAGIFYQLMRAIPKVNSIETILVTMNLRSFGPDWIHSNLETVLQKELVLLRPFPPLVNRFLLGFKNYDTTPKAIREKNYRWQLEHDDLKRPNDFPYATAGAWERDLIQNVIQYHYELKNKKNRELASQYVKSYAYCIDANNPRVKDFDKIVQLAHERNWKLVIHLLPENTERARQLVGNELVQIMTENAEFLQERYQNQKLIFINQLHLLNNEAFIDQHWTTEHYNEHGRKLVAERIAEKVRI